MLGVQGVLGVLDGARATAEVNRFQSTQPDHTLERLPEIFSEIKCTSFSPDGEHHNPEVLVEPPTEGHALEAGSPRQPEDFLVER